MLIYKSDQKVSMHGNFRGYKSGRLHALFSMGSPEMILTQVETSPFIFGHALVALDCIPGLGRYLGNCSVGKQRTLLLEEI